MARIVVIDDDKECLLCIKTMLEIGGHVVYPLLRPNKIVEQITAVQADLVVTDIIMPGITGGSVYNMIRAHIGPMVPVIVSSGTSIKLGTRNDPLVAYCRKPVSHDVLLSTVKELLQTREEMIQQATREGDPK